MSKQGARYDFNGGIPKDRMFSNLTVQCQNICAKDIGLVPQDLICQEVFVQNVLNRCSGEEGLTATEPQWDAYRQAAMRIYSALYQQCGAQNTVWQDNGDETNIPDFLAMFGKSLPHDAITGRTDPTVYALLRDALVTRDQQLLGSVPMGSVGAQLKQPMTAFLLNFMGPAPSTIPVPPCPSISSADAAAEMVECYCHALARDVPFVDYDTSPTIANCVNYLNATNFAGHFPVTSANIFRGVGVGDLNGPYLSQFFWLNAPYWPNSISAQTTFPTPTSLNNRMITEANYINSQNGIHVEPALSLDSARYPYVARDLAYCVWQDWPGQLFELAARKAIALGAPYTPKSPYLNNPGRYANQCTFVLWTINDMLAVLYNASQVAMSGAWYTKWAINRRIRPEAFANEVEQWRLSGQTQNPANIHNDLLMNQCLTDVATNLTVGNYYLPQAYPEGSPAHPSYPSGHATFSGLGITIVKAFLDENFVFPAMQTVQTDNTGALIPYVGPDLLLGEELNKLASNVGIGRDWAGVHYRSDCYQGIILGEQIGIQVLQDFVNHYAEEPACFQFHGYLGNLITIVPQTEYGRQIQETNVSFQVPDCCSQ